MRRPDEPPGRPLRVLLVEDSENDAMLLLRELRRGGYDPRFERVYTPEEMERALSEAEERGEAFEVVISDYYMPRFKAPDALALLRGLGYDEPFIVVSGKIGEDAAVGILKAGADDYLTKENMSRLCPAIERELREAEVRRERERAEEALARSEDRFRRLVEQIPAVTYVQEPAESDNPKAITYTSPQYQDMLGYPPESGMLDEDHWLKVLHPADRERVLAEELRTDQTGEPYRMEYRQIARDGSVVWVRDQATLVRDEAGRPLYWLGVQYDITEQKEAEEALRESEDRFRLLADEAVEGIALIENGVLFDANKSFTRMFGYELGELVGVNPIEFVVPEDRESVARRVSTGDTEAYEVHGLRKDGTAFPIEVRPRQLPYKGRRVRLTSVIDLTERKRAEQALREAETRYRTLVERIPAVVYVNAVDEEGSTTYMSPQIEALLGYPAQDYVSSPGHWKTLIHPEDRERVLAEHARATATGEPFGMEYRFVARDGSIVWVRDEATLMYTESGSPGFWQGIRTDITERKSIEEALQISEKRFRTIIEQSPLSIQILAPDGRTIQVNRAWEELWGVTLDDIAGYNILEDRQLLEKGLMPYIRRGFAGERTLIPPILYDPEETIPDLTSNAEPGRWVRAFIYPVEDETGEIREVILMHEDITERRRAEEALKQSEELYRTVVEQAAENIFLVDAETRRVLESNAALQTSLGYAAEELKRMTLYDIVASDRESVDRNIERVMEEGRSFLGERQYRREDGSLADVEVSVSAVPYDGREVMCIVAHDVSERKRAERALEEIREAERNRIARELHDSILQDIVYALQEVQLVQAVSENGAPALEDSAEALRRSVEGLRDAIFELRLEETLGRSFVSSLEYLLDLNRRMARGRYELELVVEDGFPSRVSGRTGQELTRIVQEALTNVRRHAEARHVRVELGVEGGVACVEVSDDGRGFATGSPKIGVGWHSMHQRALEIGGELQIESEPGEGTRVRFRVPISRLIQG